MPTIYQKKTSYWEKHETNIVLFSIPLILLIIFLTLQFLVQFFRGNAQNLKIADQLGTVNVSDYAFFNKQIQPFITAESAIIMDANSKVVLYEKNPSVRFSMASTTKLMTALVGIEYFKPSDILTVYSSNVEGVNVGFQVGEQIYFKDMLYAMLLPSGNDAAYAIAQNFPGGFEAFVTKMNEKAQSLNLQNTHYADPAGLNDDGNYTTARDLAQLATVVANSQTLSEITSTKSKVITTVGGVKAYELENLNRLLGLYGVIGLKTGYTEGAGEVLVTSVLSSGHHFIIVVMRSQNRFLDTETLLQYVTSDVTYFIPRFQ